MEENRPNPDQLLAAIHKEEAKSKRGKLKIFLGMCPGVGKTYAMLQAARQRFSERVDVLIGVVETHGRKETEALIEGLVVASKVERPYRGTVLQEMDLDTILMIRPQLAVVDELAHTNAPGSRHPKRYQDVLELLAAGIDVYTTLNVQHVESRAESVSQITGIRIQETVPDSLLDEAEEIILIDLTPEQLRVRLQEGKVYLGERAATAAENFFKEENLTALREMALRVTAERVNQDLREIMNEQRILGPWKSGERLLVAIGTTPFSESLIRWTRRTATALNAPWMAVYVEPPHALDEETNKKLQHNLTLARQLGAEVVVSPGTDLAETLIRVARQNNVSQICIGKPFGNAFFAWFRGGSLIQRLIERSGDIDIHMVRVKGLGGTASKMDKPALKMTWGECSWVLGIASGVTILGLLTEKFAGYSSISLMYLLAVVLSGMFLSSISVLVLGALSAFLWNYLFIPPRFTFWIHEPHDALMFVMYFVVAVVMGRITSRLRERELAERKQEERIHVLYQMTRTIAVSHDSREAVGNALKKFEEILKVRAGLYLADDKGKPLFERPWTGNLGLSGKERSVANWAFVKQQPAGRFTETLPEAQNFYLPLVSMDKTLGVLAIYPSQHHFWSVDQRSLIESFASLITVFLEKDLILKMAQEASLKAESQKLQEALLDSVSHELKTPLTIIAGSAEHLAAYGEPRPEGRDKETDRETFQKLVSEIRTASRRLLQTVNGLLEMTRLDAEALRLNLEWHDIQDVVESVLKDLEDPLRNHTVKTLGTPDLPPVKIDAGILKNILSILLSNAAAYAPLQTSILISVQKDQDHLLISVLDQGPGISDKDLDKIFEKFYRGPKVKTGGLGLGLSIAKRLLEVHGGEIQVRNQDTGGACFTLRLPVEFSKLKIKEME